MVEVFEAAEMIVKVKEPLPDEQARLRPTTSWSLTCTWPAPELAEADCASGVTAIAYETVTAPGGGLPLLAPMSEVAGRMSIQAGAAALKIPRRAGRAARRRARRGAWPGGGAGRRHGGQQRGPPRWASAPT